MGFFSIILEIIFPEICVSCRTKGKSVCDSCLSKIPHVITTPHEWIYPLFSYKDKTIRNAIHALKFKGLQTIPTHLAPHIADHILLTVQDIFPFQTNFKLIPIPLHKKRLRIRGYNQASLIARTIEKKLGDTFRVDETILFRTKYTDPQTITRSKKDRERNLENAFGVKGDIKFLKENYFILIDDVTTTGATLLHAKKALQKSGARHIIAFTIAH